MEANTSNETNNEPSKPADSRRQQFTNKQRMDMYAFCVLELEMHSNKVSIKKQQQAIQKVLYGQQKMGQNANGGAISNNVHHIASTSGTSTPLAITSAGNNNSKTTSDNSSNMTMSQNGTDNQEGQHYGGLAHQPQAAMQTDQNQPHQPPTEHPQAAQKLEQPAIHNQQPDSHIPTQNGECSHNINNNDSTNCSNNNTANDSHSDSGIEGKTLLELQQEVAMTRKCYSDYQKTQVLTSSMLRDVQKRFAKYYPDSAIPSRTTIKHVFEKCVAHGTVENIKNPRKATKIPQGDEIEFLLIHEPQLSLRQMAQKLNVSTGTVSRRCKALGLIPESVTIKHQQLATARRQKQMKQLESQQTKPRITKGL